MSVLRAVNLSLSCSAVFPEGDARLPEDSLALTQTTPAASDSVLQVRTLPLGDSSGDRAELSPAVCPRSPGGS